MSAPAAARAPAPSAVTDEPVPPPTTVPGAVVGGRFVPAPVVAELPVGHREGIFVQVGAFGSRDNLDRVRARLAAIGQPASVSPIRSGGQRLQRVRIGPLDTVERADGVLNAILQAGLTDAKIVVD